MARAKGTGSQVDRSAGAVDWLTRLIGLGLVLVLAAIQMWDPPLIEAARLRLFDQLQRSAPRRRVHAAGSPVRDRIASVS